MVNNQEAFQTTIGTDGLKNLRFDSTRAEECCRFAVDNSITKVTLYPSEYKAKDLSPLLPLKDFVEHLFILTKIDLGFLPDFKKLKGLSLDETSQKIQLNNFQELTTLCCVLTPNIKDLRDCEKLTLLYLSNFNPKTGNLTTLPKLHNLTSLGLFKARIDSLNGIEQFGNLCKLNSYSAPNLKDISGLEALDSLEEIEFELCKDLSDYSVFAKLHKLKKLSLIKCGEINSLSFLPSMVALKFFSFVDTNVKDGDLSYCKRIDYVGFLDKRHYNLKNNDANKRM